MLSILSSYSIFDNRTFANPRKDNFNSIKTIIQQCKLTKYFSYSSNFIFPSDVLRHAASATSLPLVVREQSREKRIHHKTR